MNKEDNELNKLFNDAVNHYTNRDYKSALKLVDKLLKIEKKHIQGRGLKACILSDSWDGSNTTKSQIMEAISHFDRLIEEDPANKWVYLGNKGNTFNNLAFAKLKENTGKLNKEIIDDLEKAKGYYQESLELDDDQPEIWINKGNVMDYLGRYLEAIECYDIAILKDERHYNAWGNRGISFWRLSELVDHEGDKILLLTDAMTYIGIELKLYPDFQIDESRKVVVKKFLQKSNIKIDLERTLKEWLPKKRSYTDSDFNLYNVSDKSFEEFYYSFCEKEGFFLNVHFDCNNCGHSSLDLLSFGIISNIDDHKTPYHFMKNLYNILDDYKAARFLLALSQYRHPDFLFLDKQRYEPDYSLNYIVNVELLKEAFIKTIGICDKIAFFLKDYEELVRSDGKDLDDSEISFWSGNSIFNKTDIIENEKNDYQIDLVAMDSIRKDLEKGEFNRLLNIRHYLVHRYFVLHDIIDVKKLTYPYDQHNELLEDLQYHEDINQFYKLSKKALRLVRNMLFSLYFFVNQKERKKKDGTNGFIPEMPWSSNWDNKK